MSTLNLLRRCAGSAVLACALQASVAQAAPCVPRVGALKRIYNPSAGESWPWYINDHSIIRGGDGLWHLFGITHAEYAAPHDERLFAHATSPSLTSGWTKQPYALAADLAGGETVLWAPHVIEHEGLHYMFYTGGGADHTQFQIKLATSTNLFDWQRLPEPLFTDGYEARDPFVMRQGDRWVMYYTATSAATGGYFVVAYRTSTDLIHWSDRAIAYQDAWWGTWGGNTESSHVIARPEGYYLIIGPRPGYVSVAVFFSEDPLHFQAPLVTNLPVHAPELVRDLDGKEYLTSCGWYQGGVYLTPLSWTCPR
jgi:arabinan endo-1,5-alpha-L-arabinosidase